MVDRILAPEHAALRREVVRELTGALETLAGLGLEPAQLAPLREAIAGLEGLFLVVVAGEFNSGKSSVINALLGADALPEGVTPTTSRITLVEHGEGRSHEAAAPGLERVTLPAPVLADLTLVDTPGTNALAREHEALTRDFIPRSDLVVFVTSADRPFSESERAFLEGIRDWGKRIVVVLNKIDLLQGRAQVEEVVAYIRLHARRLLGIEPPVLPFSARHAKRARAAADEALAEVSGLAALERFLVETLDAGERVRLKLASPLGVARRLLAELMPAMEDQGRLLAEDLDAIRDVEAQLEAWREDLERQFTYRLGDLDALLHAMEVRGHEFLDDTLRLARLPDLIRSERVRAEFERRVIADTPREIEAKVDALIDWLLESTLAQWQNVVEHVQARAARHAGRIVGSVGGRIESGRSALLATVGRAARDAMATYDRDAESRRMAAEVQGAVTGTALAEVGAVGLGTAVALIASSSAADVTGLAAAGVLATLGLFIIPARRSRSKRRLKERIAATREELLRTLGEQFRREADRSAERIRETIAPYTRFVHTERRALETRRETAAALAARLDALRQRIERLAAG